jgi:hypothetical protein
VWLEGLGKLKISNDLIGNRTRDLPACSIVPQQTMLVGDLKSLIILILQLMNLAVQGREVAVLNLKANCAIRKTELQP